MFFHQVACMQFINIAVHSVEDMNYRVHLQHEFTLLGLDQYLLVRNIQLLYCSVIYKEKFVSKDYYYNNSDYIFIFSDTRHKSDIYLIQSMLIIIITFNVHFFQE